MHDFSPANLLRNYERLVREAWEEGTLEQLYDGLSTIVKRLVPQGSQALRIAVATGVVYGALALVQVAHARFFSPESWDRSKVMKLVKERGGDALIMMPHRYRNDREVILAALDDDGSALELASEELRGDRQVVLFAVPREGGGVRLNSLPRLCVGTVRSFLLRLKRMA